MESWNNYKKSQSTNKERPCNNKEPQTKYQKGTSMLLIQNGNVYDPASGTEGKRDILTANGKIVLIRPGISREDILRFVSEPENDVNGAQVRTIDASGLAVMPGFIDTHSHFRDPGFPEKEDINTGAAAAARGGYTTVIMMGNTKPPIDCPEILRDVLARGAKTPIHVLSCANVTKGMRGEELTDFDVLRKNGAVCFTDDGKPVMNKELLRHALLWASKLDTPVSLHEEDPAYVTNRGVNAGGKAAKALGLIGADRRAEYSLVARDTSMAAELNAPLCIQHISAAESVGIVRKAREINPKIHAEATPQHFSLTEEAVLRKGTLAKCNPPLRLESDRMAIIHGLMDGTIDIIATDHAPHTQAEKSGEFIKAPSGMIGLETAFSLGLKYLVEPGYLSLMKYIACLTANPADFYHLNAGRIAVGAPADLTIADLSASWVVHLPFASRAQNSPFLGETLPGTIRCTIVNGKIVSSDGWASK